MNKLILLLIVVFVTKEVSMEKLVKNMKKPAIAPSASPTPKPDLPPKKFVPIEVEKKKYWENIDREIDKAQKYVLFCFQIKFACTYNITYLYIHISTVGYCIM